MTALGPTKVSPQITPLSAPYWEGCRQGELRLQYCGDCDSFQFYPRINCSHCGGVDMQWKKASGGGRIASYTIVRRGISKAYEAPYVVALIDLEEGPRMMSNIICERPDELVIGLAVTVQFEQWNEELMLPVFSLE